MFQQFWVYRPFQSSPVAILFRSNIDCHFEFVIGKQTTIYSDAGGFSDSENLHIVPDKGGNFLQITTFPLIEVLRVSLFFTLLMILPARTNYEYFWCSDCSLVSTVIESDQFSCTIRHGRYLKIEFLGTLGALYEESTNILTAFEPTNVAVTSA